MRLWADIPPEERGDEAFIRTRGGSSDEAWVQKCLQLLASGGECAAAVEWGGTGYSGRYHPCSRHPYAGERFCWVHGGQAKPKSQELELVHLRPYKVNVIQARRRVLKIVVQSTSQHAAIQEALDTATEKDWGAWEKPMFWKAYAAQVKA